MGPLGTEDTQTLEPALDGGLISRGNQAPRILLAQADGSISISTPPAPAPFDIEHDVASIMIRKGWVKGAEFQRQWFSGPARTMDTAKKLKDTSLPERTDLITMEWVLKFGRARTVYDKLIKDKAYTSAGAKKEIAAMAVAAFLKAKSAKGAKVKFGDLQKTGRDLYSQHVTFAAMTELHEEGTTDMDDMLASLGRFSFYVIPEGEVELVGTSYEITVKRVGVMVGDYFDFDGYQPLGWWKLPDQLKMPDKVQGAWGGTIGYGNLEQDEDGYTWVENETYRRWRNDNNRGSDFIVFSDAHVTTLDAPLKFSEPVKAK